LYFFHNGFVPDVVAPGTTPSAWDSENLLASVLPAFGAASPVAGLDDILRTLPATSTSANFFLLERARVTACNWFNDFAPAYYTMQRCDNDGATFVSSEAVPSVAPMECWSPLGSGVISVLPLAAPQRSSGASRESK
jgi:hypothetical protein